MLKRLLWYFKQLCSVIARYIQNLQLPSSSTTCTSGFGTQTHYKAPGDHQVEVELALWLTSTEWDSLLISDPDLALGQPNSSQKNY